MTQTIVIISLAFVPALARELASKPGHLKVAPPKSKFPSPASHLRAPHLQVHNPASQTRLPPLSAFAPAYAPAYAPVLEDLDNLDKKSLPDAFYDARAIAPGLKERLAEEAVEAVFTPRAPALSQPSGGGATGFAPEYAPAYAPAFFGSAKGATASTSAYQGFSAPAAAYTPQDVAARPGIVSQPSGGGASGFAPEYAPAYAPAFFGSVKGKGATAYQSASTPAFASAPQAVASMPSTYSEPSGGASGFAPLFAPEYAPSFFGSAKRPSGGATAYSAATSASSTSAYAPQDVAARPSTYNEASGGGATGFAPEYAPAYAPAFFGSARGGGATAPLFREAVRTPTSSFSDVSSPAYTPQYSPREGLHSSSTGASSGASGFAPLFAPAYSAGFFGSRKVSSQATSSKEASSGASGFAALFAPAYSPGFSGSRKVMDLDATQASPNVSGTISVALMGLSIAGVTFAVLRFRHASRAFKEEYLPAPN